MKEGKKILVLTDAFMPPAYVPRVRTLCDVLVQQGWNVRVLTEEVKTVSQQFAHAYPIESIPYYKCKGMLGMMEWGVKFMLNLIFDHKGRYFTRKWNVILGNENFDYVFCSTFHTFPLTAAARLAQQRDLPLHVDLRDVAEQCGGHQYNQHKKAIGKRGYEWINSIYQKKNIIRRDEVLRCARSASSVSPWHVHLLKKMNDNVHLIYNGYDQRMFHPSDVKMNTFKIIYTGMVYGKQMQDPTLLFQALHNMQRDNALPPELECHFYVKPDQRRLLDTYAKEWNLTECMHYHDYVNPQEIPTLLQEASVVLVLSNKTGPDGPHGIMTTKFYEALGVEKPVLCVRSDEAHLAQVIRETNAGVAVVTAEEVEDFIKLKYDEWKTKGYTRQHVNREEKDKYSRQEQAIQFIKCLNSIQ